MVSSVPESSQGHPYGADSPRTPRLTSNLFFNASVSHIITRRLSRERLLPCVHLPSNYITQQNGMGLRLYNVLPQQHENATGVASVNQCARLSFFWFLKAKSKTIIEMML